MTRGVVSLLDLAADDVRALVVASLTPTPAVAPLARRAVAVLTGGPQDVPRAAWIAAAGRLGATAIRDDDLAAGAEDALGQGIEAARWCDLLVVSHAHVGFARAVAEATGKPVVNAGEGGGEFPAAGVSLLAASLPAPEPGTTVVRPQRLRAAVCGDLAESRTARAFLTALAATDGTVLLVPARGRELPDDEIHRLARRVGRSPLRFEAHAMTSLLDMVDTVLLGPESPGQLPLFREVGVPPDGASRRVRRDVEDVDVLFVAAGGAGPDRLVREPFRGNGTRPPQGVEHVVPLRVLEVLLEHAMRAAPPAAPTAGYRSGLGLSCRGDRCFAAKHRDVVVPDFEMLDGQRSALACRSCGARTTPRWAASKLERRFHPLASADAERILPANVVLFRSRGEALACGFEPGRRRAAGDGEEDR